MNEHQHSLSDHDSLGDKVEHVAEEIVEDIEGAIEATLPTHLRLRAWARRRQTTNHVWRAAVLITALTISIGGGIIGLLLPVVPGWALFYLGLAIAASEFTWAHRLHEPLKKFIDRVIAAIKERIKRS